jgi:hypothetical protein
MSVKHCLTPALLGCVMSIANAGPPAFGRHYPHGEAAVSYLYGPHGMWRDQSGLFYDANWYTSCATPAHRYDAMSFLSTASTNNVTAADANCVVHWDLNEDGEISDEIPSGSAFHEHSGRGAPNGNKLAAAHFAFWHDDNWLARYVALAYARPQPIGLHDGRCTPVRWRQLGGDNHCFKAYAASELIDRVALNGIRRINAGDFHAALADWQAIKRLSNPVYDSLDERYEYELEPQTTYYYSLWLILSERLLSHAAEFADRAEVLQHAIAIRSNLLSWQIKDVDGVPLGWRTDVDVDHSLINTETQSLAILALGAEAQHVFETGSAPLTTGEGSYSHRTPGTLSAVAGVSSPGYLTHGPVWNLERGPFVVDFEMRAPNAATGDIATIEVLEGASVRASTTVPGHAMPCCNQWVRMRVTPSLSSGENVQVRVFWHGDVSVDVGAIRISKPHVARLRMRTIDSRRRTEPARGSQLPPARSALPEDIDPCRPVTCAPGVRR